MASRAAGCLNRSRPGERDSRAAALRHWHPQRQRCRGGWTHAGLQQWARGSAGAEAQIGQALDVWPGEASTKYFLHPKNYESYTKGIARLIINVEFPSWYQLLSCISRGRTNSWRTELYVLKRKHKEDDSCNSNLPPERMAERQLRRSMDSSAALYGRE
jgi:hypothetical protein